MSDAQEVADDDAVFISAEEVTNEVDIGEAPEESDDENDMDVAGGAGGDAEEEGGEGDEAKADGPAFAVPAQDDSFATFAAHEDAIYDVAAAVVDGAVVIASGSGDDSAVLTKLGSTAQDTRSVKLSGHGESVCALGFSHDGKLLATGDLAGSVHLWETAAVLGGGAAEAPKKGTLEGLSDCEWLDWHPRGDILIAGGSDGTVWMWLAADGSCMQVFAGHEGAVSAGSFTADGNALVTGGEDGTLRIWAPRSGRCKHTFSGHGFHEGPIATLCVEKRPGGAGERCLTGGLDGTMRLTHLGSKRALATFVHSAPEAVEGEEEGATWSVEACAFLGGWTGEQGTGIDWVASGGVDGTCKVWDVVSGTKRAELRHGASVTAVRRAREDAPMVVTASADGRVRLWETRNGGEELRRFEGHMDMIVCLDALTIPLQAMLTGGAPAGDELVVVTGSDDRTAKVWRFQ